MRYVAFVFGFLLAALSGAKAGEDFDAQVRILALNVYHESRGETELGKLMVAYITVKRAEENRREWGGNTIRGVVRKGCQFSWTCDPEVEKPLPGPEWDRAVEVATLVLLGLFEPPVELVDARFYMNPDTSSSKGRCWMAQHLRQVAVVGNHYFYAEGEPWYVPPRFKCKTA